MGQAPEDFVKPLRRALLPIVAGVLAIAACGSAATSSGERAAADPEASRGAIATAGSEAAGPGDWTATVRPLGDSNTTFRALPGDGSAETPPPGALIARAPAGASSTNPAVTSLVNAAGEQFRAGQYARAAATLERAIAIEPRNAWLWHRLAATRLAEGRLEQAAELAAKSNALGDSPGAADRDLQAGNWRLIGEVRRRQGNSAAAAAADARAAKLAN